MVQYYSLLKHIYQSYTYNLADSAHFLSTII